MTMKEQLGWRCYSQSYNYHSYFQSLTEFRRIREQQDREYEESLEIDRAKVQSGNEPKETFQVISLL